MTGPPSPWCLDDGATFIPTEAARGPWGETVSGVYVGGLLAHAVEGDGIPDGLTPVRLTVDLLRPVGLHPVTLETSRVREGRRLHVVDVAMLQGGRMVARGSFVLARRSEQPEGAPWTPEATAPAPPILAGVPDIPMVVWASNAADPAAPEHPSPDLAAWQRPGPNFAWLLFNAPLIADTPNSPFVRAAMAGDVASSLTHHGPDGLSFINADYAVSLSRLPQGELLGMKAVCHSGHAGIAVGSALVLDTVGLIGVATVSALAQGGEPWRRR